MCLFDHPKQIGDRLGRADARCGEPQVELPFDAQDQLGPGETVNAKIFFQPARQGTVEYRPSLRMKFMDKGPHDDQEVVREVL